MKNIWKRSLSMLLALVLVLGMVPVNILAAGSEDQTENNISTVLEGKFGVGESATIKGSDTAPSADNLADVGTHWEGPVESTGVTCGKDYEHTHTDACYTTPNVTACAHFLESTLLGHPDTCTVANLDDPCTSRICIKSHKTVNGTKYHVKFECQHTHSKNCYTLGCDYALKGEHSHSRPACYSYTWTVAKNQYNVNITVVGDASGIVAGSATTRVTHGDNVTFKMTGAGDDYTTWYAEIGGELIELPKTGEKEITVKAQPQNVAHDGTFNIEVKLSNKKAATYTITVVEENALEGCGYELSAKENLLAGAASQLKVTVPTNSDSVTFSPKITISGEGASYADGVITVGTGDVTVTVDYGAKKLSGKADGKIEYTADMSLEEIRQAVFSELAVEYFPGGVQWNTPGVKYEYKYWSTYTIYGNQVGETWQTDNYAEIGTDPADKDELVGYTTNHPFGYTGLGTVEHVKLSYNGVSIEADIKLTNYFTIDFVDENGNALKSETLEYGEPIVAPADPTKADEVDENGNFIVRYTFAGWSPALAETVTGNVTYKPNFTKNVAQYTITWSVNGNETTETYNYGEMPSFKGSTDKADKVDGNGTVIEKYIFTGWTSELAIVTGPATYTAVYDTEVQKYTVTFKDEDGTVLKSETLEYGAAIVAPADPTKADDQDANGNIMATYTFAGWGSEVAATVTGDVVYTAKYDKTAAEYTVTVVIGEKSETFTFAYGYSFAQPANPTAPEGYGFECWEIDGKCAAFPITVVKNVTLTAKFVDYVAMIGETYYSDLLIALKAAQDGETIELLQDVELYTRLIFASYTNGKNVTLDGNGYKLYASTTNWGTGNGKHLINVNCDNVTLKDIVLDSNGIAEGVNIYMAQNITFDNVTITNKKGWNADLTVNGSTLTVKTKLVASYVDVSLGKGVTTALGIVAANDAVFDVRTLQISSNAYPNTDLDKALATDGTSFYTYKKLNADGDLAGYTNSCSRLSNGYGYKLLENATVSSNVTLLNEGHSGILDLNGHVLTIADDKTFTVSGELTVVGNGDIAGDIIFDDTESVLIGPAGLSVKPVIEAANLGFEAIYEDGVYTLKAKITWVNGDETTYAYYAFGAAPVAPEGFKTPTDQFSYEFTGWDKEIVAVTGAVTYTAQFTENLKSYTIKFVDVDGITVLNEQILYYGENVVYGGKELVKEFYTYRWDPAVAETVTGEATYKLVWTPNNDTNENGIADELETITINVNKADDGDEIVITGAELIDGNYIYDSTGNCKVTIVATPVVDENGVSKTYVSSITGGGVGSYDKYIYTYVVTVENGMEITVNFKQAGFEYDEDGQMRFYVGMEDPDYEMLYNALIKNPAYSIETVGSNVKYLARTEGQYELDLSSIRTLLSEIEYVGFLAVSAFDRVYPDAKTSITLPEKWLNVGDPFEEGNVEEAVEAAINEGIEEIKALIANGDYTEAISAIGMLASKVTTRVGNIGCHAFGKNTQIDAEGNAQEIISVVYDDGKMHLENKELVVTLVDDRIDTDIKAEDITVIYRDYTAEELFALIAPELVNAETGNPIVGDVILSSKVKGNEVVGTFEVTFEYKGSYDYKPKTKTVTVTVEKASASIDIPNVQVRVGENYNVDPSVTLGNKYGEPTELTDSMIQFLLGLDIADFDYDEDGVKGLNGKVQLFLPAEIQELLDAALGLTGGNTSDGMEMSLSDLMKYLDLIPETSLDSLNQILESIMSVVEAGDLTIVIGGDLPTKAGAYLYGAVSTSSNYETAYDVAYIVIAPELKEVYLEWNYTSSNMIFTWNQLKNMNLGATAYDDAEFTIINEKATAIMQNLFFGIDVNGEFVIDLHGKNTDAEALENALGTGAFVQLAFTLDIGNELVYAVPIVRPVVIVPGVVNVELVGSTGTPNDEMLKEFNNQPQSFGVIVTDENGNVIYSDHYQNVVALKENAQIVVYYLGMQSNGKPYHSTEKPVHAGAYVAIAVYTEYATEDGELTVMNIEDIINGIIDGVDFENIDVDRILETIRSDLDGLECIGMDAGLLVIEPTESEVEVTDKIEIVGGEHKPSDQVHVESNAGAYPDTTVIVGFIGSNGTFSENGMSALVGNVNVDFPRWIDELIAEYAPSVVNGISVADFGEKLVNKLPEISGKLEELGATSEMLNALSNAINNVHAALAEVPENVTLSFKNDVTVSNVGVYLVVGVVTDSDHIPSVDAGILVITPEVTQVELKWNHEDDNNVWTKKLLSYVDLYASAYNAESGEMNEAATGKIAHQFISVDENSELVIYNSADQLGNGAYVELAYIQLEADGQVYISDMIARVIVLTPDGVNVNFHDGEKVNNDRLYTYNGAQHDMGNVVITELDGAAVDISKGKLTISYVGVMTNGETYNSAEAPTNAGAYTVIVSYVEYDEDGEAYRVGTGIGTLVIEKAPLDLDLEDTTVTWDGSEHFVDVTNPNAGDYVTVIVNRADNTANIILENDLAALKALIEERLETEIPGTYDVAAILAAVNELLDAAEELNLLLPEEYQYNSAELLAELKSILEQLPQTGTVTINGSLPAEIGTYECYALAYADNYKTEASHGYLQIVPVQVKIEIEDASKHYGQDDPDIFYTVKYYDHLGNELADAGTVSVELNRAPGQNVGKYGITATVTNADEKNYEIVAFTQDAVLEIKPAEITISVDHKGKVYGQKDPTLTYNAAVSEGKGVIGSDLVITLDRVDGEDVGTYAITATVAENANYKIISNVDGLFTIEAKEITLADVALNGTLTYNGTEQTQAVIVTDGVTYQVSGNTGTNAGAYTLTVTGNGNYTGEVKLPWSIAKAQVQITLENVTVDVDDRIPQLNYTVTDVKGTVPAELLNLKVSVDVAKNAAGQNIVGTYQIKAEYATSDNWTVSVVDANLTVELGNYVCWNVQTGTYYDDLSDALMAAVSGQTVQMLVEEIAEDLLLVNAGITLDLNGSLVKAGNVLSFGQIKDSAENVGGLVISNNAQEAFTVLQKNNAYMPLYDVDAGCYRFFAYEFRYHAQRTGTGYITYAYTIEFENAAGYELLAAYGTDTGICFRHYLHWDNLNDNEMVFEYSSDVIKRFGQNALSVIENGSGVAVLTFKVSGLSVISGQELDSRMEASSATNVSQGDSAPSYDVP